MPGKIYVGMSGWNHTGWRGNFYPKGLKQKEELYYAAKQVNSIEINGTFYSLKKPENFQDWYSQAPDGFRYAIKGGQFITHIRRLRDAQEGLSNFLASGVLCLKEKTGPFLWQLPPNFKFEDDRLKDFLQLLPKDMTEAGKLARKHTAKLRGRAWIRPEWKGPLKHAFEFRHESFFCDKVYGLLEDAGAALVFAHSGKDPELYREELLADFVYLRLHGEEKAYSKGYRPKDLTELSKKLKKWSKKGDVHLYFDNKHKTSAPTNARKLLEMLKIC